MIESDANVGYLELPPGSCWLIVPLPLPGQMIWIKFGELKIFNIFEVDKLGERHIPK